MQFLIDKNFELKLKEVYDESDSMTMTMTPLQLAEMDGRTEDTPVYVALAGRIYDVSSKREAYGPGKNYNCFVGRDASLHYATGCTDIKCPGDPNNLNEDEQRALNKWLEFYHNHDKYRYVGRLIPDPVETVLEREFPDNHQHGSSEEISSMQEVIESKEEL